MSRANLRAVAAPQPPVFVVASSPLEAMQWAQRSMVPRSRVKVVTYKRDLQKARGVKAAKVVILGPVADASPIEAAYVPFMLTLKFGAANVTRPGRRQP